MFYLRNVRSLFGALVSLIMLIGCSDAPSDVELKLGEAEIEAIKKDNGVFLTYYLSEEDLAIPRQLGKDKHELSVIYNNPITYKNYREKGELKFDSRISNYTIENEELRKHIESKFTDESLAQIQSLYNEYIVAMIEKEKQQYQVKIDELKGKKKSQYKELSAIQERLLAKPEAQLLTANKQISDLNDARLNAFEVLSQQVNDVIYTNELPIENYILNYNWNRVFSSNIKNKPNSACYYKDNVQFDNAKYCWKYSTRFKKDYDIATRPETKPYLLKAIKADLDYDYAVRSEDIPGTPAAQVKQAEQQIKDANIVIRNKFGSTLSSKNYRELNQSIHKFQRELRYLNNQESRKYKKIDEKVRDQFVYRDENIRNKILNILGEEVAYSVLDNVAEKHRETLKFVEFQAGETFPYDYNEKAMLSVLFIKEQYKSYGIQCLRDEEYFDRIDYEHDNYQFHPSREQAVDSWLDFIGSQNANQC